MTKPTARTQGAPKKESPLAKLTPADAKRHLRTYVDKNRESIKALGKPT